MVKCDKFVYVFFVLVCVNNLLLGSCVQKVGGRYSWKIDVDQSFSKGDGNDTRYLVTCG